MEAVVIILLALWFMVSLGYQLCLRRLMPVMARWDLFRVVPSWHLYTEIPKAHRLYYRDRDAAGQVGEWSEVPLARGHRSGRALFNPELFASDATYSLMEFLTESVQRTEPLPPEKLVNTIGWRGMWLCAAQQARTAGANQRQFEVRQQGLNPGSLEERVYASDFQPLPAVKGAG